MDTLIIVGVMALAFVGLIYMRTNYVDTVYRFQNEQFDSRVRQALSAVSQDAERMDSSADLGVIFRDCSRSIFSPVGEWSVEGAEVGAEPIAGYA